ncbi:MAG: L-threonylcarbamoyladenylate synthase [Acidimicrobiia bacterium]
MLTITVDAREPDRRTLRPAAEALLAGRLVAFPTETVYGLGALALDPRSAGRIFEAKGRPPDDPLIVHVLPDWDLGLVFAEVTEPIRRLADEHWPGALTIVGPKHPSVPDIVTSGLPTVAVRAPSHPVAVALLELVGVPVAAPSANRFSYVSPTTADHVASDLGDVIDVLVDGGPTPIGIESTIVRVNGEHLTLLRPGSVVIAGIGSDTHAPSSLSPGRLEVHYSPSTPTRALAARSPLRSPGPGVFIGYDDSIPTPDGWQVVSLGDRRDLQSVAHRLYEVLRTADALRVPVMVVEFTGVDGLGAALDDRIHRAAGGQSAY